MRYLGGRAVLAAAAAAGVTAMATATPAGAATTWDGRCTIQGQSTFDQPIGGIPRSTRYVDTGTGTCTGTLNGAAVANAPIELAAEGMGSLGCLASHSVMFGTLTFTRGTRSPRDDVAVWYAGEANGALGQSISRSRGRDAGHGISYVLLVGGSDPSTAEACRTNTLSSVRWTANTQSITPSEG